jgi:hypothetical protein
MTRRRDVTRRLMMARKGRMIMDRYWAYIKEARRTRKLGPYETRAEAYAAALPFKPKTVQTGRGADGGFFDVQWRDLNYQRTNYRD